MPATLFLLLGLLLLLLLAALMWWRFKGGGKQKDEAPPIAATNHKSLPSFHYAPAPAALRTAPAAAQPLAATSPLAMLLPEDEFFRQQEQELQGEADRAEAEEMERRGQAERPAAAGITKEAKPAVAPSTAPAPAPSHQEGAAPAVSALDVLSPDERPTSAPEAVETAEDASEDTVAESLYDNPLTSPTPTRNDEANRLAAVALRQRKRAAIKAKSGDQKTALVALLVNK